MSVPAIYNMPSNRDELNMWAFANAAHHADINRRIFQLTGGVLPSFVLDPIPPNDISSWSYLHQQMHNAQNEVLGIQGNNLVDVNWSNPNELAEWIDAHASEHYQAGAILGLG